VTAAGLARGDQGKPPRTSSFIPRSW
jgi:hypothetical protein